MRILLTGANGYIGKRLLPHLLSAGHHVTCCVRDRARLPLSKPLPDGVEILEADFMEEVAPPAGQAYDAAFYLMHSLHSSISDFSKAEAQTAGHFKAFAEQAGIGQVVYLSGIANDEGQLSEHLSSRNRVEKLLESEAYGLTVLRAGIIVGSGSASFEIIRDLVEKLPVMVLPKWVRTRCQPIGIRDVLFFLTGVLAREDCYDRDFDIGGPDVLTYRQMMAQYAEVRGLKRWFVDVPFLTPRLSSYWLYFVTATSYTLAVNLVGSMKVEVVCRDNELAERLGIAPAPYEENVRRAFEVIKQQGVPSSWKDSFASGRLSGVLADFVEVPEHGCFRDYRRQYLPQPEAALERIWRIGGTTGWYAGNSLWKLRGWLDKLAGGVGLRRGRTHPTEIHPGDALDFWRVIAADREAGRLLLYAEMRLPGEAWLEFRKTEEQGKTYLEQTATFRPHGLLGRLYWWAVFPLHELIFQRMARKIARGS